MAEVNEKCLIGARRVPDFQYIQSLLDERAPTGQPADGFTLSPAEIFSSCGVLTTGARSSTRSGHRRRGFTGGAIPAPST